MNFLLHREWALRETGDPVLAAASMLPDLWRMAERRARLGSRHFRVPVSVDGAEPASSALRGLEHHLTTDRWFHDDPLFTDGEAMAVGAMRAAGVRSEKMILFAHPLWELCLDGALVKEQGLEATRSAIGAARAAVAGEAGADIAERAGLSRLLPEHSARRGFLQRLESLWDALQEGRWIAAYTSAPGLTECIVRMRERIGFGAIEPSDRARLEQAIAGLELAASAALEKSPRLAELAALSDPPPPPAPAR